MDWLQIQALRQWAYLFAVTAAGVYFVVETIKGICYLVDRHTDKQAVKAWAKREAELGHAGLHTDA